jgi:thiol:disulfide interchange protein
VFSDKEVLDKLEELDVLLIQADDTNNDPQITLDLRRYGRVGLPTNLIAPADPDKPLIIMPQSFGPKEALQALEQASK